MSCPTNFKGELNLLAFFLAFGNQRVQNYTTGFIVGQVNSEQQENTVTVSSTTLTGGIRSYPVL